MTETKALLAETGGTEITRFNALRHGVLSRYTVLPWENADEYLTRRHQVRTTYGRRGTRSSVKGWRPLDDPLEW